MFHVYLQGILSKKDGPELPAPTITSVTGGIDSLIVNGNTNMVPSTPTNFRVTNATASTITLAWDTVGSADGYEIYRNGNSIGQVTTTTFQDTGLQDNSSFNYTVRSYNSNGHSPHSPTVVGTTEESSGPENWPLYTESINEPLSWEPINEVSMTDHAGFAGIRCIGTGNHPSSNPNDWVRFEDDSQWKTLDFLNPLHSPPHRSEYPHFWKIQGGIGILYGGARDTQSDTRTATLGMATRTKKVGEEWGGERRRVIYKYLPWAQNSRRMNPTLHYDPVNKRYVSFFGEQSVSGDLYGFRCISSAWSPTPHIADSWQYKEDRPLLTHDIVQDIYPDLMEPQYPGNDYERYARMYPKFSFFHEGKNYFYFEANIWCISTGTNETIDFCLATEDYTDHTAWERVDFDWTNIRAERRPHGSSGTGSFWNRRGHRWLHEMTYYDGWYYGVSHASNGTFDRGPALYRSRSPLGPYQVYGSADVPLVSSPYGNRNGKSNLILYRDVWFIFCSIRDTTDEQDTPLWEKYAGANVAGDMRVVWGGYYDPLGKINDILNSG